VAEVSGGEADEVSEAEVVEVSVSETDEAPAEEGSEAEAVAASLVDERVEAAVERESMLLADSLTDAFESPSFDPLESKKQTRMPMQLRIASTDTVIRIVFVLFFIKPSPLFSERYYNITSD